MVGWKRTTQGVRRWPVSTFRQRPVRQHISFTVWSPLQSPTNTCDHFALRSKHV